MVMVGVNSYSSSTVSIPYGEVEFADDQLAYVRIRPVLSLVELFLLELENELVCV